MASETTVTPDQSTTEQVKKKVNDDIKAIEEEVVTPSKENGGADVEEKPKTDELASSQAPVTESEEKKEDQLVDPPVVMPVENVEDVPVLDVKAVDVEKVTEDCSLEQDVFAVSVPAVEAIEKESEEQSKLSDVVVAPVEAVDKVDVALPTPEPEVPESDSKTIEKPESVAELEEKAREQPEVTKEVEEKSEVIEPKESAEVEISKDEDKTLEDTVSSNEEQISKDQVPIASESCDTVIATNQEAPSELKDVEVSAIPDVVSTPDIDVEKVEEVKQPGTTKTEDVVDVVEKMATEAALDAGEVIEQKEENNVKVEQEIEEKNVNVAELSGLAEGHATIVVGEIEKQKEEKNMKLEEDIEEKNVKVEEVKQPETTKTEDASDSNAATEVTEESFEGEKASRDVELVPGEKKEECIKDDVDVETSKDRDLGEKADAVDSTTTTTTTTTTTVSEPIGEPKELVSEEKAKDTQETVADKLEKAAEVVEGIVNSDAPNLESSKDLTYTKIEGDLPKQGVPAKPTQKQSNNIMSKVKQSIVKVKKAIIGKSPSSKTISSDAKTI